MLAEPRFIASFVLLIQTALGLVGPLAIGADSYYERYCALSDVVKVLENPDASKVKSIILVTDRSNFPRDGIVIPPELQKKTGFTKIEKVALIAEGGIGAVYRVLAHRRYGAPVDLVWKELRRKRQALPYLLELEQHGMNAQHILSESSPYFAKVYLRATLKFESESGPTLNEGYLMEYVGHNIVEDIAPGGTLSLVESTSRSIVSDPRRLSNQVQLLLRFAHQGTSALQAVARQKVVHRDVKPENFTLDDNMRARLIDLGFVTSAAIPSKRAGTPEYFAPEVTKYGYVPTAETDRYSFALILYEAITGKRPYLSKFAKEELPYIKYPLPGFEPEVAKRNLDKVLATAEIQGLPEAALRQFTNLCQDIVTGLSTVPANRPKGIFPAPEVPYTVVTTRASAPQGHLVRFPKPQPPLPPNAPTLRSIKRVGTDRFMTTSWDGDNRVLSWIDSPETGGAGLEAHNELVAASDSFLPLREHVRVQSPEGKVTAEGYLAGPIEKTLEEMIHAGELGLDFTLSQTDVAERIDSLSRITQGASRVVASLEHSGFDDPNLEAANLALYRRKPGAPAEIVKLPSTTVVRRPPYSHSLSRHRLGALLFELINQSKPPEHRDEAARKFVETIVKLKAHGIQAPELRKLQAITKFALDCLETKPSRQGKGVFDGG